MKRLFIPLILFLSCNILFSQVDREFWFAVPKETDGHGSLDATNFISFKVTSIGLPADVTISMPANPSFAPRQFTVPAGQTHIEVLATTWAQFAAIYNNNAAIGTSPITGKTNNGGFLITSTTDITVYYDFDNYYNREIFSLKGKNALGTEFFTPFQNIWFNDSAGYNPDPYSTIEIVATEANTTIMFTPQPGQSVEGRTDDTPWTITLNRGEGYTVRAKYMSAKGHLSGLKISSSKKIAVTINDDSVRQNIASCRDIIGDQLVPTDKIGSSYLVLTGNKSNTTGTLTYPYKYPNGVGEQIIVTATKSGTIITFADKEGTVLYQSPTLDAGGTDYFSVDISNAKMSTIYITSNSAEKVFYTYHLTGISCEIGGAIIPPVTNCTGSNEVSFYRSETVSDIAVNMLIPYDYTLPFNDPSQSYHFFNLVTFNTDGNIDSIYQIPDTCFEPIPAVKWAVLKMSSRNFNSITTKGRAHKIVNQKDLFHMGMTNGSNGVTNKYGYFSSFSPAQAEVYIPANQEDNYVVCYGEQPIPIVAKGGAEYTWHYGSPSGPPTYLSDPKSSSPNLINAPVGSHNFYVEVFQPKCFGIDTLKVSIQVLPIEKAVFEADKYSVCSPDTVTITDKSSFADMYYWKKQIGSDTIRTFHPQNDTLFKDLLINSTNDTINIIYKLFVESNQGCSDDTSITIKVFPAIKADFSPKDTTGYHPFNIPFKNQSISGENIDYQWILGNDSISSEFEPFGTYLNTTQDSINYTVMLRVTNGVCSDSTHGTVTVLPQTTNKLNAAKAVPNIALYPNPAKDVVNIQYFLEKPGSVKIEIYSTMGKLLLTKTEFKKKPGNNETSINLEKISDKLFLIKLYTGNETTIIKGIKE